MARLRVVWPLQQHPDAVPPLHFRVQAIANAAAERVADLRRRKETLAEQLRALEAEVADR